MPQRDALRPKTRRQFDATVERVERRELLSAVSGGLWTSAASPGPAFHSRPTAADLRASGNGGSALLVHLGSAPKSPAPPAYTVVPQPSGSTAAGLPGARSGTANGYGHTYGHSLKTGSLDSSGTASTTDHAHLWVARRWIRQAALSRHPRGPAQSAAHGIVYIDSVSPHQRGS
jgi:hypothetical protein